MAFASLKQGEIVLFLTSDREYDDANRKIVENYVNKEGYYCVYITVNKPYVHLAKIFRQKKLDESKIIVIDTVTPINVGGIMRVGNAIFVGSPKNLTNVSILVVSTIKNKAGGKRVLFLDSLDSMILYNGLDNGIRFMRFLIGRMREWDVTSVIFSLKKETDEKTLMEAERLCDRVIDLDVE